MTGGLGVHAYPKAGSTFAGDSAYPDYDVMNPGYPSPSRHSQGNFSVFNGSHLMMDDN